MRSQGERGPFPQVNRQPSRPRPQPPTLPGSITTLGSLSAENPEFNRPDARAQDAAWLRGSVAA